MQRRKRFLLILLFLPNLQCTDVQFGRISQASVSGNDTGNDASDPSVPSDATVICDPFGDTEGNSTQGLAGRLRYFSLNNDSNYLLNQRAYDYVSKAIDPKVLIVMRKLDVGLRSFTEGFPLGNGNYLTDTEGNRLIEFFGIEFQGKVRLGPNDPEGPYRFALESDDGTILEIATGGGAYDTLINHDGNHGMQFRAADRNINMVRATNLPIRLLYYQGPRNEIGLRLLWRRDDGVSDWRVVNAENLVLPDGVAGCE